MIKNTLIILLTKRLNKWKQGMIFKKFRDKNE